VSSLNNQVASLNSIIDQQIDQINRLKLPGIIKDELAIPNLVDDMVRGIMDDFKLKNPQLASTVDALSPIITGALKSYLNTTIDFKTFNLNIVSVNRSASYLYDVAFAYTYTYPLRWGDIVGGIPIISGIITYVHFNIQFVATVDAALDAISNVQYRGLTIT